MSATLLTAEGLRKGFGGRDLLDIPHLEITERQCIGLAGPNGCGKTTLLHILAGLLAPDEGIVSCRCKIAFMRQPGLEDTHPDAFGKGAEPEARRFLPAKGPGKSGGEQTRRAIATALSQNAPLLFADEPTNNLDLSGITMLENALAHYKGAVVLVSHDRVLLDAVCTTVWAIEDGQLRVFPGNYSEWIAERERERNFAKFEFEQYQREKSRLTAEMRNIRQEAKAVGKPPKRMSSSEWRLYKDVASIQQRHVQSRAKVMEKRIEQMEVKEKPQDLPKVKMQAQTARTVSRVAVRVECQEICRGGRAVLRNVSLTLPTGSKTVILGDNGAGKTTLAEYILSHGQGVTTAPGLRIGSFSQTHALLQPEKTVLENARADSELSEGEVRTILANLLLPGDAVKKPVKILSGGERAKTAFARLLASPCGMLVLDEPTNHIDSFAAEALEHLLCLWQGTLLLVTHDRRLAGKVAERLLFVENGSVCAFEGTWADWKASQTPRSDDSMTLLLEQMRRAADAANGSFRPFV